MTSLLYALGMDGEEILNTFYGKVVYKKTKDGWRLPFDADRMRGLHAVNDLIDADSGEVVVEAGKKLTVRQGEAACREGRQGAQGGRTRTSTATTSPTTWST